MFDINSGDNNNNVDSNISNDDNSNNKFNNIFKLLDSF